MANIRLLIETLDAEGKVIGQAQGAALGSMLGRDRLYFEAPRGHGRELSSARAVVGYLRHWAMSLKVLGAAMVMNATLKVYKGAPHGTCTTLKDQARAIC